MKGAKAVCLQLLWSLFLVFATVQYMTFTSPSDRLRLSAADVGGRPEADSTTFSHEDTGCGGKSCDACSEFGFGHGTAVH